MKNLAYYLKKRIEIINRFNSAHNKMVDEVDPFVCYPEHIKEAIRVKHDPITKPLSSAINAIDVICCKLANPDSKMPADHFAEYVRIVEVVN